jgi:tripartite-type tricarboxylate transporter receptor subunit TctC
MFQTARLASAAVALLCFATFEASAQAYPSRPIRVVVPWPAGGITDVIIRGVSQHMSEALGQPIVVDNRPGAGGTLGAAIVAKATPDGQTLLVHDIASHCISASIYKKLPYGPLNDFEPVAMVAGSPMVVITNPKLKIRTLQQFIELAKAQPGKINYASSGVGAITHLAPVRFFRMAGLDVVHVPFKGSLQSASSVMNGETSLSFSTMPAAVPQAKAGRLVILATSFARRSDQLPDVPTIAEVLGQPFDLGLYSGMWVPKGTSNAIVQRLHKEVMAGLQDPRVKQILMTVSAVPGTMTPPQYSAYLKKEVRDWAEIVRVAGVKAN